MGLRLPASNHPLNVGKALMNLSCLASVLFSLVFVQKFSKGFVYSNVYYANDRHI